MTTIQRTMLEVFEQFIINRVNQRCQSPKLADNSDSYLSLVEEETERFLDEITEG